MRQDQVADGDSGDKDSDGRKFVLSISLSNTISLSLSLSRSLLVEIGFYLLSRASYKKQGHHLKFEFLKSPTRPYKFS